jgi:hypothetical protein
LKKSVYITGLAIILLALACGFAKDYNFRKIYYSHNELIHHTSRLQTLPYLKAHHKDGSVYIFEDKWETDSIHLKGMGTYYDFKRTVVSEKLQVVPLDSIALFETNTKIKSNKDKRVQMLSVMTAVDVVLGIICLSSPKTCFGSCPTFYLDDGNPNRLADAESFSNAISPSMEYNDFDDIRYSSQGNKTLSFNMLNEALETHVVKKTDLAIISKPTAFDVFISSEEKFYVTSANYRLVNASASEGEITNVLEFADLKERFSLADEKALVNKEEILMTFDAKDLQNAGLKLSFRQTMMTTYALYSAIGYMGDEVSDIFAKLETSKDKNENLKTLLYNALGGIEVYTQQNDLTWKYEGEMYETGPIAQNHEILPLKFAKEKNSTLKVKLVLNKGLWRLDHAALLKIEQQTQPIYIQPLKVFKNNREIKSILTIQKKSDKHQCELSMPGDAFKLLYSLPEIKQQGHNYQVFLDAKGYYIEWMRASWLKDKDLLALKGMLENPVKWLNDETSNYKKYEAAMEKQFWESKWTKNNTSYESL